MRGEGRQKEGKCVGLEYVDKQYLYFHWPQSSKYCDMRGGESVSLGSSCTTCMNNCDSKVTTHSV